LTGIHARKELFFSTTWSRGKGGCNKLRRGVKKGRLIFRKLILRRRGRSQGDLEDPKRRTSKELHPPIQGRELQRRGTSQIFHTEKSTGDATARG